MSQDIAANINIVCFRLKSSNLKYLFVTNTTKESQNVLHSRLTKLGFDIEKEKIFTSLLAAVDFIKREQVRPHLMLEDAALEDFQDVLTTTSNDSKGNDRSALLSTC